MNRREVLVGFGGTGLTALSGCLESVPSLERGTPVEKRITGRVKQGGTGPYQSTTILELIYWSEDEGDPQYRRDPDSPLEKPADDEPFFLDDETYAFLESQYEELLIHMHVCTEGFHESEEWDCRGPQVSRDDFNKFTLEDEILI